MVNGVIVDRNADTQNKKRKLHNETGSATKSSNLFAPFRSIGLVSPTSVPFSSVALGKTSFQITTSVGRCLHTYDLRRGLNLVFLSRPQTPHPISAFTSWKDRVIAAWSSGGEDGEHGIWIFKRGRKVGELEKPPRLHSPLQKILVFGSWVVGCSSNRIEVWKSTSFEHYTTITPVRAKGRGGEPLTGHLCTIPTFLNKVFVGRSDGDVDIWNVSTGRLIHTIRSPFLESGPVSALEPSSVLSLLAIGRADGSICLHNVLRDELALKLNSRSSKQNVINSISFRTDGLGAGKDSTEDGLMATTSNGSGDITFWDLNNGGQVRGVLYGAHSLASSENTDSGGSNKVEFLPGQDVIISTGLDNSLKSWIFDANSLSPIPRILHHRGGHASPITRLCFVPSSSDDSDTQGKWLLSTGRDRAVWGWSLRRDGQSTELSQGSIQKKAKKLGLPARPLDASGDINLEALRAPEVISIACSLNRDGGMGTSTGSAAVWTNSTKSKNSADNNENAASGWESIVTGHRGDKYARTWFWGRKKAGRWAFETGDGHEVSSVAMTTCGTFALVGSVGGNISMFNLQSGIKRQSFPSTLTPTQARRLKLDQIAAAESPIDGDSRAPRFEYGQGKHTKAVSGLMVDNLNKTVFSCSLDGKVKFWEFLTGRLLDELDWFPTTAITSSRYHRANDLIALACEDLSIRLVDTRTKRTVRELWGCMGQIADFCFSQDGRWMIAASMDTKLRVWDLPTGHLISLFRMESPCTSLAFSDTGEFLATAHAGSVGINIWNNRSLFAHVPTQPVAETDTTLSTLPTSSGELGRGMIDAAFDVPGSPESVAVDPISQETGMLKLDKAMQSLSVVPRSRWQTLLHLETIRERNKPTEPPKAPEKAPFFLPSLEGATKSRSAPSSNDVNDRADRLSNGEHPRISKMDRAMTTSQFSKLLHNTTRKEDCWPFITHLTSLSPSTADIEIRSLNADEFVPFVKALIFGLRQRTSYELMQAWMAVFLRVHGDDISNEETDNKGIQEALGEWRHEQEKEGKRLGDLVGFCGGVLGFLRSVR